MIFVIVTHVPHLVEQNQYFAYAPYVREMNIWIKEATKIIIVAPMSVAKKTPLDLEYQHKSIDFVKVKNFDVLHLQSILGAVIKIPTISWQIFKAMKKADHIHLRCPGNVGLLGCFIQLLFPNKPKTAKYAGNWDPKSKQPWSYRWQKAIIRNTFFTRNMKVLVYGEWEGSSKNLKPFFTATYNEKDKLPFTKKEIEGKINFVFVGTLVSGKNPIYAIRLVEELFRKGFNVHLRMYGEGLERNALEQYIMTNQLTNIITLEGIQSKEVIQKSYQNSHFVILPSKSEGWPKAVAEAMFWGCIPLATAVSCVPWMLDYGNRGLLLKMNLEKDALQVENLLKDHKKFEKLEKNASDWSRGYTLDIFEEEIKKLMVSK